MPGVEPANIVILGGGVVGENAAIIATGMKGKVYIVDKSKERLKQLHVFMIKLFQQRAMKQILKNLFLNVIS